MFDVDDFTDDQKRLLNSLVADFDGPTATATVLLILEEAGYSLKGDFDLAAPADEIQRKLFDDLEACRAALHYWKVQQLAKS